MHWVLVPGVDVSDCSQELGKVCDIVPNINKACAALQSQAGNYYPGRLSGKMAGVTRWRLYQLHYSIHVMHFDSKVFTFFIGRSRHALQISEKSHGTPSPSYEFLSLHGFCCRCDLGIGPKVWRPLKQPVGRSVGDAVTSPHSKRSSCGAWQTNRGLLNCTTTSSFSPTKPSWKCIYTGMNAFVLYKSGTKCNSRHRASTSSLCHTWEHFIFNMITKRNQKKIKIRRKGFFFFFFLTVIFLSTGAGLKLELQSPPEGKPSHPEKLPLGPRQDVFVNHHLNV